MNEGLLAIRLAEKLNKGDLKVLKYFAENGMFVGSYGKLAAEIYGNPDRRSNVYYKIMRLNEMGILLVYDDESVPSNDENRTYIEFNPDWKNKI